MISLLFTIYEATNGKKKKKLLNCPPVGGWHPCWGLPVTMLVCVCVCTFEWLGHRGNSFWWLRFFSKSVVSEGFEGLGSLFHLGKVSKAMKAWVRYTKVKTVQPNWHFSSEFDVDGGHTGYWVRRDENWIKEPIIMKGYNIQVTGVISSV